MKPGQPENAERSKEVTCHFVFAVTAEPDLPEDAERNNRPLLRLAHGDRKARELRH